LYVKKKGPGSEKRGELTAFNAPRKKHLRGGKCGCSRYCEIARRARKVTKNRGQKSPKPQGKEMRVTFERPGKVSGKGGWLNGARTMIEPVSETTNEVVRPKKPSGCKAQK